MYTNLTPHDVTIVGEDDETIVVLPSEGVARAAVSSTVTGSLEVNGSQVNIVTRTFGEPVDLPDPQEGVMIVVSLITAQAAKAVGRDTSDLLVTSDPVRGDDGRIIGCRSFSQV